IMTNKPGRNDDCPCGSGKKYKKCCALNESAQAAQPAFNRSAIPQAMQIAVQHHNAGRWSEAEAIYQQILAVQPNYADALHLSGLIFSQWGQKEIAAQMIAKAIKSNPREPNYHNSMGGLLNELGKHEEALVSLQKSVALNPKVAQPYQNMGNALRLLGRYNEAQVAYQKAISLQPDSDGLHCALGNLLSDAGKLEEAGACFQKALALNPNSAVAYNDLGNVFSNMGKHAEAIACFQQSITLLPSLVAPYSNLGNVYKEQGKYAEAITCFQKALTINPHQPEVYSNLGNTLKNVDRYSEGVACLQKAIELKPDYAVAHYNLGNALQAQGRLVEAAGCYQRALALQPGLDQAYGNLFFISNYTSSVSPAIAVAEAARYGEMIRRKAGHAYSDWRCDMQPQRLRIGLVSGDLRAHPVGYFLQGLLEHYDPSRIEFVAYPTHAHTDALTQRMLPRLSAWTPLYGKNDPQAAQQIHNDGIHILLDLSGYTTHNRLPVFCRKPAPVQATWLGYFATTGVKEIDYLIGDPHITPPEEESHFVEKIWRLPETYLCFTAPDVAVEVSPLPALTNGYITFCCFNNLTKIGDAVVALWAQVMHAVPGSRLFLKTRQLGEEGLSEQTLARFASHGIGSERLMFEGYSPRAGLLAAYQRVDIALDPFPYPGGTTSAEALWMGVPVLTKRGDRFLSHVGETVAHNVGLANWIAQDEPDYLAKAVAFAADLNRLAELRGNLRTQVLVSPLYDAARFARHFENAM
ncbi:MAG: tetratricopeptide repeat protein, partial [Gallionella sp.]|nr:tetratricopeptide repeat protein [Gallionella sp.]